MIPALERWRGRPAAIAGFGALLTAIAWVYGLVGGSRPFGSVILWDGWARCIADGPLPCEHVGYPIGVTVSVAKAVIYGTYGLTEVGLSTGAALNLLGIVSVGLGLAAIWYLGRRLGGTHLAGALAGVVYFGSPLVISHEGLYQLFLGFALLPVPVALAVALAWDDDEGDPPRVRTAVLLAALLGAGFALVNLDPYPWVVASALAGPVPLVALWRALRRRRWTTVPIALGILVVLAIPGVAFRSASSSEGLETKQSIDFYRGMGVDAGVALIPTTGSTLGDLTGVGADPWDAAEFTGDGSQIASAYLGLPLAALAAYGIVVLLGARRGPAVLMLGVGGAACLVLSLGPSLKVVDRDPTPHGDTISAGDYLMPAADATVSLPWASVYTHQPFASMRATYRWQAGARVVLACFAAAGLASLARRRPVVAVIAGAVLLLDVVPQLLWHQHRVADARGAELAAFQHDMDLAFGDDRIDRDARVVFLPAANDYLMQYIAPKYDLRAYNLSFDKAIALIRPQQPKAVTDAEVHYADATMTGAELCGLFREDLVDAVVFDDFSLRWDSYRWPPAPAAVSERRAALEASGLLDTPGIEVDRGHLSVVTTADPDGPCHPA